MTGCYRPIVYTRWHVRHCTSSDGKLFSSCSTGGVAGNADAAQAFVGIQVEVSSQVYARHYPRTAHQAYSSRKFTTMNVIRGLSSRIHLSLQNVKKLVPAHTFTVANDLLRFLACVLVARSFVRTAYWTRAGCRRIPSSQLRALHILLSSDPVRQLQRVRSCFTSHQ